VYDAVSESVHIEELEVGARVVLAAGDARRIRCRHRDGWCAPGWLAPWPGIGVVVLSIVAFAVSRERRSFIVAGLLGASGVVGVVYALIERSL
jgi:hypothetical protein